ncbi:MAG: hypothetical protein LBR05_05840, partial [Azoarcus sp.]|nr:hypothetical protein [Azoarcus sp.]
DIGRENLDYVVPLDAELEERARAYIDLDEATLALRQAAFAAGERIRHPIFGPGTVTAVDAGQTCYTVQFDGLKTERTIQFGAPLERE